MNKKFAVFLSALFCCFIGGMALVSLLLPMSPKRIATSNSYSVFETVKSTAFAVP